jgi:hypothetical protein
MLSRAEWVRVRDVLRDSPSDTIRTSCLEHSAAAVEIASACRRSRRIPPSNARQGHCEARYGAQPPQYEPVIRMKTATALGLTIPASFLHRADQVIE